MPFLLFLSKSSRLPHAQLQGRGMLKCPSFVKVQSVAPSANIRQKYAEAPFICQSPVGCPEPKLKADVY